MELKTSRQMRSPKSPSGRRVPINPLIVTPRSKLPYSSSFGVFGGRDSPSTTVSSIGGRGARIRITNPTFIDKFKFLQVMEFTRLDL